jgi:hypothetical protein
VLSIDKVYMIHIIAGLRLHVLYGNIIGKKFVMEMPCQHMYNANTNLNQRSTQPT